MHNHLFEVQSMISDAWPHSLSLWPASFWGSQVTRTESASQSLGDGSSSLDMVYRNCGSPWTIIWLILFSLWNPWTFGWTLILQPQPILQPCIWSVYIATLTFTNSTNSWNLRYRSVEQVFRHEKASAKALVQSFHEGPCVPKEVQYLPAMLSYNQTIFKHTCWHKCFIMSLWYHDVADAIPNHQSDRFSDRSLFGATFELCEQYAQSWVHLRFSGTAVLGNSDLLGEQN